MMVEPLLHLGPAALRDHALVEELQAPDRARGAGHALVQPALAH